MKTPLSYLTALFLATVFLFTPTSASAQGSFQVISPELMDAMDHWTAPQATLESVAWEQYPDAIAGYASAMEELYGVPFSETIAVRFPQAFTVYEKSVPAELQSSSELAAFLMVGVPDTYAEWQASLEADWTFAGFVGRNFTGLQAATEALSPSIADSGTPFIGFLTEQGKDHLVDEATETLMNIPINPGDVCACATLMTTERAPTQWKVYSPDTPHDNKGWKQLMVSYYDGARGAAKSVGLYRHSKNTRWEGTWDSAGESRHRRTSLTVRFSCWGDGELGKPCPLSSTCTGELAMRMEYGTRVRETVDIPSGISFSREARSSAADLAQLFFDPPGPAPQTALVEKGVAVVGSAKSGWDADHVVGALFNIAQIVMLITQAEEGASLDLTDDLVTGTVTHLLGMITREGSPGHLDRVMTTAFNTAGSIPFHLQADKTYTFDLLTNSSVHTDGYGSWSKSWANVDSAYAFAGVARNIQCADQITEPGVGSIWDYASASSYSPYDLPTLREMVRNFIYIELGAKPDANHPVGHFP